MKKFLQILLLLLYCLPAYAQAVDNYLHTDKKLIFDNTEFELGWSSHPREFQYLQEYFPEGQNPGHFTDMLSVWLFVGNLPADQWIQNMENSYAQRKLSDPVCDFQSYGNEGEYMFDCLISDGEKGHLASVEFNIYRCKNIEVDGKPALLICFYSTQAYGDNITPFLIGLKERRMQLMEAMIKFEYPSVTLGQCH